MAKKFVLADYGLKPDNSRIIVVKVEYYTFCTCKVTFTILVQF